MKMVRFLYKSACKMLLSNNLYFSFSIFSPNPSYGKLITSDRKSSVQNILSNCVIISVSKDIYKNLALEDWIYKSVDLSTKNIFILLMWCNSPSVVIGRHQNPWTECSLDFSAATGISIARRNSGGGTVYHDAGNLNCCFLMPRKLYNRKTNLNIICESLKKHWPLNLGISSRDDILLNDKYKISGTASKIGRTNAYHHCTVLVNVDEVMLHQALHRELVGIESKATSSIKSEVKNLQSACSGVYIDSVIEAIGEEYRSLYKIPETDIFAVEPEEELFPGIKAIETQLKSWEWCFGKTPRFHITRTFPLCPSFSKWEHKNLPACLDIKISVCNGVIEDIIVNPKILEFKSLENLKNCVSGVRFSFFCIDKALEKWVALSKDKVLSKYLKSCIAQIVLDIYI